MPKYWKLVGATLAVAILAGVLVAAVPAVKPDKGGPEPQIITLFDGEVIDKGGTSDSAYVKVEGFSKLKVFATWEGPTGEGSVQVAFF